MNAPPYLILLAAWLVIFLFVLTKTIIKIFSEKKNLFTAFGTIAGNVNNEVELVDRRIGFKTAFSFSKLFGTERKVRISEFDFIGLICGDSMDPFGLQDGTVVFCKKVLPESIERNDALILLTSNGPNKGKPKARICLGKWGDPEKSDPDLIKVENHYGTVRDYFLKVAPMKYGYDKPYDGPIEGWLKTLSCDQCLELKNAKKISRPHEPSQIIGRVEYIVPPSEFHQHLAENCVCPAPVTA